MLNANYDFIKALHLIFMVSWFAGLFYMVRLFIYYREAADKTEAEKQVTAASICAHDAALVVDYHNARYGFNGCFWCLDARAQPHLFTQCALDAFEIRFCFLVTYLSLLFTEVTATVRKRQHELELRSIAHLE